MESRFLALADELLIEVVSHIDDRRSLCNLARVSSRLRGLTEPFIYESILIRTGVEAEKLVDLFRSREARLWAVRELQIRYKYEFESGIEELNPFLEHLLQLRHLTVESPCCNDSPWVRTSKLWESGGRIDYVRLFEKAVSWPVSIGPGIFSQLQSCMFYHTELQQPLCIC
jgi:hypothetical protein